jgi:hypothetical protein
MGEVIIEHREKRSGETTSAAQEFWLQNYCYSWEQRLRGLGVGGATKKTGDILAYLFTDCALASACHFVFSWGGG